MFRYFAKLLPEDNYWSWRRHATDFFYAMLSTKMFLPKSLPGMRL
jgi:hypothetical protein